MPDMMTMENFSVLVTSLPKGWVLRQTICTDKKQTAHLHSTLEVDD